MKLEDIARKVENVEQKAHCLIDYINNQIYVVFDNRNGIKIALLTPYAQMQMKKSELDEDVFTELLFSVKRLANWKY